MEIPKTPTFSLAGKRALVSGASRGLGLASAAALAEAGAGVVLTGRSAPRLAAVTAAFEARGWRAHALSVDVTDIQAIRSALEAIDPIDILVNNAGTNIPCAFTEVTPEDYDAVFEVNVKAAFFLAQSVARRLLSTGRAGSIINISSQMGHVGGPDRTVYCATKHAMEGMTKAMAAELGPHGIRVNTLCPTFIETPLTRPFFENEAFLHWVLDKIKLRRLGKLEDIMGTVVFLASDASALMTGSALMLDGGWTSTS